MVIEAEEVGLAGFYGLSLSAVLSPEEKPLTTRRSRLNVTRGECA